MCGRAGVWVDARTCGCVTMCCVYMCVARKQAGKQASDQASKQTSKQANKQASNEASKRASKQASKQACKQTSKQASKQASMDFVLISSKTKYKRPSPKFCISSQKVNTETRHARPGNKTFFKKQTFVLQKGPGSSPFVLLFFSKRLCFCHVYS